MVKNEEIVTILEHFQSLFLLLFLLNGENAFIFVSLKGKYSKCSILLPLHLFSPFFSHLVLKRGESSGMGNEDIGKRERENQQCSLFKASDKMEDCVLKMDVFSGKASEG